MFLQIMGLNVPKPFVCLFMIHLHHIWSEIVRYGIKDNGIPPPAAAPRQVSPVWPAHCQEDEDQCDANLKEPPDHTPSPVSQT